jgi:hypothetical protein
LDGYYEPGVSFTKTYFKNNWGYYNHETKERSGVKKKRIVKVKNEIYEEIPDSQVNNNQIKTGEVIKLSEKAINLINEQASNSNIPSKIENLVYITKKEMDELNIKQPKGVKKYKFGGGSEALIGINRNEYEKAKQQDILIEEVDILQSKKNEDAEDLFKIAASEVKKEDIANGNVVFIPDKDVQYDNKNNFFIPQDVLDKKKEQAEKFKNAFNYHFNPPKYSEPEHQEPL